MTDKAAPIRRQGARLVAEIPPGASVAFFRDRIIIASPDAPPRILGND